MTRDNHYFLLYANCIPVRGHIKSIICDLEQGTILDIPNLLCNILQLNTKRKLPVKDIKE